MFCPAIALAVIKAVEGKKFRSVIELGNQTARSWQLVNKYYPHIEKYNTPQDFYKQLGIDYYASVDINSYNKAIVADLNEEYQWGALYNIVTNNGTSEHIFNQKALFVNMRRLCKRDGIMVNCLPVNYFDHGFYNYNPNLFFSIAKQNQDKYLFGYITNANGDHPNSVDIFPENWLELPNPTRRNFLRKVNPEAKDQMMVFVSQKTNSEDFKMPIQHTLYSNALETDQLKNKYA